MNAKRQFLVTYWQGGLLKVSVQATDVMDACQILKREAIRATQIVSIRETPVEDTMSGLQRAVI